jgi:hypothetical protein
MPGDCQNPTGRDIDWVALVKKVSGSDPPNQEVVYEFSQGRKFKTTDHTESGIYDQDRSD